MLLYASDNRYDAEYLDLLLYSLALAALVVAVGLWRVSPLLARQVAGLVCSLTALVGALILTVGPPSRAPDRTVLPAMMVLTAFVTLALMVWGSRQRQQR